MRGAHSFFYGSDRKVRKSYDPKENAGGMGSGDGEGHS